MVPAIRLLALLCLCASPQAGHITIYRDSYGVPSISAARLDDALYGLGYVMAQDDAVQMARNYKQARGRLAEVDGYNALLVDGFLRSLGIEQMAQEEAGKLNASMAGHIQAFCDGANRALAERRASLPAWIKPFTPVDVLAEAQLINAAFALEDIRNQLLPSTGSNQFAVAPSRSATGHAIVSTDPHLPWSGLFAWYEFSLYCPEMNFHGVTIPGAPFGAIGHNDHVAWSATNDSPRLYDFFTVKTDPAKPDRYNYFGQWRTFEMIPIDLNYVDHGVMKTMHQVVKRTAWGPMVPFRNQAVQLTMLGDWSILTETLKMDEARSAADFRNALRPLGLSMWNLVYGDTSGNIGYQYNARVPKRDPEFDYTKPRPGDDPKAKWGPLWSLDELPHAENPSSGLLVNCNSAPDLTTLGNEIPAGKWPPDVTHYGHTTRYDRLAFLL
ncbi:MAG TPA: penicillin acylase family protein, partial [Chthonomonadales bacterium]|nr:penicillin acylase family protein [Chthonomonadales bacterium]